MKRRVFRDATIEKAPFEGYIKANCGLKVERAAGDAALQEEHPFEPAIHENARVQVQDTHKSWQNTGKSVERTNISVRHTPQCWTHIVNEC